MPRYFFDIQDRKGFHRDPEGVDCDDMDDARRQAQTLVADVIREQVPDGDRHEITCDVRDRGGRIAYRAKVSMRGIMEPSADEGMSAGEETGA